jgi:O-Antigen ligase
VPNFTIWWVLTYCFLLLSSFFNPAFGVFAYLFEYYLRPSLHWWGKGHLPELGYNMIATVVLTVTYLMRRQSQRDIGPAARAPGACLIGLALLMFIVTATLAVNTGRSLGRTQDYLKFIMFHGLIVGAIRTEWAFDGFIGLHMLGAGWWGYDLYTSPKQRSQSRLPGVGSGDTLGDNFAAAHLLTVIPFLFVYLLRSKNKALQLSALFAAPFVINTFILCNSRGAVVSLMVMLGAAALLARRGQRLRMVVVGAAVVGCFIALADPEFMQRQQTTSNYQDDGSAMQRLESWQGGYRLIYDHPFGTGGEGYVQLSPKYIPEVVLRTGELRAPHNTFVLVASEWGLPGLALFLGYYFSVFRLLAEVRRCAGQGDLWYYRSVAIQLAMIGLLVAGAFADRLYAEAPYWLGALAVVLHRLQAHKLKEEAQKPDAEVVAVPPAAQSAPPVGVAAARAMVRTAAGPAR